MSGNRRHARIAKPLISFDPLGSFGFARTKPASGGHQTPGGRTRRASVAQLRNYIQRPPEPTREADLACTGTSRPLVDQACWSKRMIM